jgi:hypothetical protein
MIEYEKYFKYKIKYIELLGGAPKKCNKNNISTLKDINIIIKINGERNTLYKTVKEGSYVGFLIIELLYSNEIKKFTPKNKPLIYIRENEKLIEIKDLDKLYKDQTIVLKER